MMSEYLLRLPRRLLRVELTADSPAEPPPGRRAPTDTASSAANAGTAEALNRWQSAMQNAVEQLHLQLRELRQALPQLALELACILWEETLAQTLPLPAEVWQRRIEALTALLGNGGKITLALHPADRDWWQQQAPESLRQLVVGWNLVPDGGLRRGEYRAECGEITAWWRWAERLRACRQALEQRLDADALESGTSG